MSPQDAAMVLPLIALALSAFALGFVIGVSLP